MKLWLFALVISALMAVSGGKAKAQDAESDTGDAISTEGIFTYMPPAYKIKNVVKIGESRASEFIETATISGNASTSTLSSTTISHPLKVVAIRVYCLADEVATCAIPTLSRNGTPINDDLFLRGGQARTIPLSEPQAYDTSDSFAVQANATITGAVSANVSRVVYELMTARSFQPVVGGQYNN